MTALPNEEELQARLRDIAIPACPAILLDLDAELRKEEPDQRAIARLISRDVALSGQIMQVANSPAFTTGRRVDSIVQALTILGVRQIFNLVVTQLLKTALAGKPEVPMDRFWDNSANTARVAAELARRLRCMRPDRAYTFGLFHDCGIPLLMKRYEDYRTLLGEANAADNEHFTAIEDARLGTNHAVVGYFLARRWKLPDFVAQAILQHHDYRVLEEDAGSIDKEAQTAIALNALAERAIRLHSRLGEENEWPKAAARVGDFLGLSQDDLEDLIDQMIDWLESREQVH